MDQDKPGIHCEKLAVQRGNVRLEVELRCPIDPAGPRPAVVFFPGSGISPFWDYVPGFLEWFVDGVFLPRGFCVLYMNKRGIGASEGNWQKNSFQGRADDAHAAVRLLRAHAAIDSRKIGLIGHSQGGWIANLAAA